MPHLNKDDKEAILKILVVNSVPFANLREMMEKEGKELNVALLYEGIGGKDIYDKYVNKHKSIKKMYEEYPKAYAVMGTYTSAGGILEQSSNAQVFGANREQCRIYWTGYINTPRTHLNSINNWLSDFKNNPQMFNSNRNRFHISELPSFKKWEEYADKYEVHYGTLNNFYWDVKGLMGSIRTTKALLKKWPEIEPLLPSYMLDESNATPIMVPIERMTRQLHIPNESK